MILRKFSRWILPGVSIVFIPLILVIPELASGPKLALLQEGGRQISQTDWEAHVPLFLAMAAIAIIVDAAFIFFMMRNRSKSRK